MRKGKGDLNDQLCETILRIQLTFQKTVMSRKTLAN